MTSTASDDARPNCEVSQPKSSLVSSDAAKALDDAIKMGLIARNVCEAVSPPRKQHREINPLTVEQSRRLLDAAKGHPQEALFVLVLATGMRWGGLLGLKWQDINLDKGVLQYAVPLLVCPQVGDTKRRNRKRKRVGVVLCWLPLQ